jgi:hypothetical protein
MMIGIRGERAYERAANSLSSLVTSIIGALDMSSSELILVLNFKYCTTKQDKNQPNYSSMQGYFIPTGKIPI